MYKFLGTLIMSLLAFNCATAQFYLPPFYDSDQNSQSATMKFTNNSYYTLTIKIVNYYGGLYETVILGPHSSQTVYFDSSATYKLKIKAEHNRSVSYHNGGTFNVTSNSREYSQGEMKFSMSTYGSGIGPSISAAEFSRNN